MATAFGTAVCPAAAALALMMPPPVNSVTDCTGVVVDDDTQDARRETCGAVRHVRAVDAVDSARVVVYACTHGHITLLLCCCMQHAHKTCMPQPFHICVRF